MSVTATSLGERVAELRETFDRSFAQLPRADAGTKIDLLAIRAGVQSFALRLSEIAGVFAGKTMTRVPGGGAGLLGIAGFRGAIVPVYDLHVLLGQSGVATPRWLVIAAAAPLALAFEAFDGQLRVAPDAILPVQSRQDSRGCTRDYLELDNVVRPIIHLLSVLDAIKARG